MEDSRVARKIMDERCPGCEIKEKLKNLQVLRHIMLAKEKGCGTIGQGQCTARDGKKSIGFAGSRKIKKK